jgi:hypothetical protein
VLAGSVLLGGIMTMLAGSWPASPCHHSSRPGPEVLVGATFLGLGWLSGMTMSWVQA